LKVFALLLGLQIGYTKLCCFLGEWDIGQKHQYFQKQWPKRELLSPEQKNVLNTPSNNPEKVY
jgi:hypothetical protein